MSPAAAKHADVAITDLVLDTALQPRLEGLDDGHVHALEENPEAWPPLSAVRLPNKRLVLVDGFHRMAAAQNRGLERVTVEILDVEAESDLRSLAFDLNKQHGRPLNLSDRRAEAERRLQASPPISNLEVARATGLSPSTIATLRTRLEEAEAIPATEQRISRAGNTYTPVGPSRKAGELPAAGLGELLSGAAGRVFSSSERVAQRKLAAYLRRLSGALKDQYSLKGWDSAEPVAEACRLVLGEEAAAALGAELGPTSAHVLQVAIALGYKRQAQ